MTTIMILTTLMLFAYWFTYTTGNPLGDRPDVNALLFVVPQLLAWRRLKRNGVAEDLWEHFNHDLAVTKGTVHQYELKQNLLLDAVLTGRKFFTWERSLLCPVCLHWWLTVLFVLLCLIFNQLHLRQDFLVVTLTYLVNHLIIRKIA